MKKNLRNVPALLAIVLSAGLSAHAQATRTWISGVGDDANPCSRTAPCKTFAGAISKTAPGGEIDALDPGGFGALTITKSITLDGGGGQVASVLVAGTNGIVVSAGANDVVTIRNMRIDGLLGNGSSPGNAGVDGISLLSAAALHIEHCFIFGFSHNGISITPNSQPSNGAQVFVDDTTSQDNGQNGLYILGSGTNVRVSISNSRFSGNAQAGVFAGDYSRPSIFRSDSSGNGSGFVAQANGGSVTMSIGDSTAANNFGAGVQAGGGSGQSTVRLEHVTLFSNATGFVTGANGTIQSFGNNYNGNPGAPNSTLAPQ